MRWEEQLPGGGSRTAHEASMDLSEKIHLLEPDTAFDVLGSREVYPSALQTAIRGLRRVPWRDYNGVRGPVPTAFRAHDWQTCRVLREWVEWDLASRARARAELEGAVRRNEERAAKRQARMEEHFSRLVRRARWARGQGA